jgi:homospermidine synthase
MNTSFVPISFQGNILIIGFGSIAQATLPVLFELIKLQPTQVTIISRSPDKTGIAKKWKVNFVTKPLREDGYEEILHSSLKKGDFLLNLSVEVSSLALLQYCWRHQILYLDTCIEPWQGRYSNASLTLSQRSNYALREEVLAFRLDKQASTTAIVTQGANPGLISSLLKQALINMAADNNLQFEKPVCHEDWARLANHLNIKVIHIAERDTQTTRQRKQYDEFVNTWSVDGFVSEGLQPAELGWGSHEKHFPVDGAHHGFGSDAAIYLKRPGLSTKVRSWTPKEGSYHGFLVTHGEAISIADYLTLRENGAITYRPTVHYAYHPCDDAVLSIHEMLGKNGKLQSQSRIIGKEITKGRDELGVLLLGNEKGAYWYGSRLSIEQARTLAPNNSATSLQVVAGIMGGMVWAIKNPERGIIEPEDIDFEEVMAVATPYLGDLVGEYSQWSPLLNRSALFDEEVDESDPWQFINFRVS